MSRVAIRPKNSFRIEVDTVGYSSFQCRDQIEVWKDVSALEPLEKCWVNFLCCQVDTGRWWAFVVLVISQFSQGFPWFQAIKCHRGIDFCKIEFITYFWYLKNYSPLSKTRSKPHWKLRLRLLIFISLFFSWIFSQFWEIFVDVCADAVFLGFIKFEIWIFLEKVQKLNFKKLKVKNWTFKKFEGQKLSFEEI